MIKKIFLTLLFTTLFSIIIISYLVLSKVAKTTNTSLFYFPRIIYQSYKNPTLQPNFNFVLLGLDPRNDKLEKTETTDTIMVCRLTSDWKINIVSIPRDLWIYSLNNKINQIYPLSLSSPDSFQYIQSEFSKITNNQYQKTIIISTNSLVKLTEIVGGVDVTLKTGFIDEQYPNPDYITNPSPKTPIYKKIEFKSGPNHLDTTNITEFVRSRKSLIGGTDLGRIERQQLLIEALLAKIKSPQFYKKPTNIISLYNFYKQSLISNLTDQDIISLAFRGYSHINSLSISKYSIPSGENPKTDIIYHPSTFINAQWVFIPQDKQYKTLQEFITNSLHQ